MENNNLIHENPNNNVSNIQTNKGASFITSDTPGFLVSNNKNMKDKEIEVSPTLEEQQPNVDTNPQAEPEPILVEKQTINDIEEVQNEFGNIDSPHNNIALMDVTPIEAPVEITAVPPEPPKPSISEELVSNPSSIFNIPLISIEAKTTESAPAVNQEESSTNDEDNGALKSKDITAAAMAGVASTATPVVNNNANIDFFSFDFSTNKTEIPQAEETSPITPVSDGTDEFGFTSVIRPNDKEEVIPDQSDRIELSKFLEPKENLIKNPDEVEENDNNVIRINDDSASDTYRSKNNTIKYSLYAFYVLLAILLAIFIYRIYKSNTDFALTRDEITLAINSTYQAEIVSNSKLQDNKKYQWTSSNTEVVKVDENGLITSVGGGEATITVQRSNNKKTLKVTAVEIAIESITFEEDLITLKVGDEQTLEPIINNDKSIVIDLLWESSDPTIASVDQNGRVTANSVGSVSIYVYDEISGLGGEIAIDIEAADNGNTGDKEDDKENQENEKIPVTKIALNKSDTIMEVGEYIVVSAVVRPANATNKKVTWSTSNKNVATVSSSGKITAKSVGTATITATTSNGKTAKIKITVTEKFINVTSVSLNKEKATINVGEAITLSATVSPKNATNKGIIWTSSDESVATVSSSGKVTAKKAGTTTITATTKDGNKKDVCTITVKEIEIITVTGISLDKTSLDLEVGDTSKLVATVSPEDATYPDVTWETSDSSVVAVEAGKVTAKGAGTATIKAITNNGKEASCQVTVKEKVIEVTDVKLNTTQINLTVGETYQLTATITPSNATDKSLTWISNKSSYASVENGLVTAKKAGNAVITVKTSNGEKATCSVKIAEAETTEPESETETGSESEETTP